MSLFLSFALALGEMEGLGGRGDLVVVGGWGAVWVRVFLKRHFEKE